MGEKLPKDRPRINLWSRLLAEAEALDRKSADAAKEAAARRAEAALAYAQIEKVRAEATAARRNPQ